MKLLFLNPITDETQNQVDQGAAGVTLLTSEAE
jgi:hypothetical protein